MSRYLPLHKVAKILGFKKESDLLLILRLTPGLPFITRKGVILADPDELPDAMAARGIAIPGQSDDNEDDASNEDDDTENGDDADSDDSDERPVHRRRR